MVGVERSIGRYQWDRVLLTKESKATDFIKQLLFRQFSDIDSGFIFWTRIHPHWTNPRHDWLNSTPQEHRCYLRANHGLTIGFFDPKEFGE
jgi:hypothetical protein